MEQLNIEITDAGVKIDATGYKDKSCLKELDGLLKALEDAGIKPEVNEQKLKPEGRLNKPETAKPVLNRR